MDSTSLILQIVQPFVVPILTTIGSLVLFHYSQRYLLQKNRRDIVRAILAKSYVKFGGNRSKSVLQIKNFTEPIKFILQFAYFVYLLIKTYYFLQKIIIPSSAYAIAYFVVILQDYAFIYFLNFLIFFNIYFILLYFLDLKMKKAERRNILLYILFISLSSTTSDLRWGAIFYLSFYFYLYVTLLKLNINYLPLALVTLLIFYGFILIPSLLNTFERLLLDFITHSFSDKRIFINLESLIFNKVEDKPKIRVQVGSTFYEGKVKEIDRDLVIISVDKQLKEHEIHIRWEAIQAFEVIE